MKKYNITLEEYFEMIADQNFRCVICNILLPDNLGPAGTGSSGKRETPIVDYDHKTGKIRGILCRCCNTGIGFFKKNKVSLLAAYLYLNDSGKKYD